MITLAASAAFGFGGKQHIGRVTGRDKKWGLKLDFVGSRSDKRNESTTYQTDEPGLYLCRSWTRKNCADERYVLVFEVEGSAEEFSVDKDDALKIAREMDNGRDLESIVEADADGWEFVTAAAAEKRVVAATIDGAVDHCWQVIQGLDQATAKKVLDLLRKRVVPPKPAAALNLIEEAPTGLVADANLDAGVSDQALGLAPTPVDESAAQ